MLNRANNNCYGAVVASGAAILGVAASPQTRVRACGEQAGGAADEDLAGGEAFAAHRADEEDDGLAVEGFLSNSAPVAPSRLGRLVETAA